MRGTKGRENEGWSEKDGTQENRGNGKEIGNKEELIDFVLRPFAAHLWLCRNG